MRGYGYSGYSVPQHGYGAGEDGSPSAPPYNTSPLRGGGYGGGGPGQHRGEGGYGQQRPGPYDRAGPGGGGRDNGYNRDRSRRSASPDYSRGAGQGQQRGSVGRAYGGGGGGYGGAGGGYGGAGGGAGRMEDRPYNPAERGSYGRMDLGDPIRRNREGGGDRDESEVIRARVTRERPCRTLFVRNLKFGLRADEVRKPFLEIGDIKTFFDLTEKRAMAFITFYDSRAAMMAKDRLHQMPLHGRAIDVHYSLPRDADLAQACDREKGQGTLSIAIRNAPPGVGRLSDQEIYNRFAPFGDIKTVYPHERRPDVTMIEYYDSRATVKAFDQLNGTPLGGGFAELRFEWDKPNPPVAAPTFAVPAAPKEGYGYAPVGGRVGGPAPPPPHAQHHPPHAPYPPYSAPPPPALAPVPPPPAASHGVEQAKRMQDLLASLVQNQGMLNGASGASQPLPPPAAYASGYSPVPPAIGSPMYGQQQQPQSSVPPVVAGLMGAAAPSSSTPPYPPTAPPPATAPPASTGATPAQVQALLAMLAQQKAAQ
ncbi:RNA recognition motif domain containing protein [Rhodotorula toruloides]|uniref:RNA recognition motif domain containing protein n=1 Tax=Rhodotorula toruloides TaxID=5286 RepID=A0A511KMI2_RHOTO|nr:RNA recognition motif domain containing protein [Rhodotorula toruloides]